MRFGFIALILIAAAAARAADPPPPSPPPQQAEEEGHGRIVGGKDALPHTVPWQAELFYDHPGFAPTHACGGALIAPDWVLTASHCPAPAVMVRLGTQNLIQPGQAFAIDQVYRYPRAPDYQPSAHDHADDIALLHIRRAPTAPDTIDIKPILLPDPKIDTLNEGQPVSVTGWGSTKAREQNDRSAFVISPQLQQAPLFMLPMAKCDADVTAGTQRAMNPIIMGDKMTCAAAHDENGNLTDKIDTCQGDSGGPLVRHRTFGGREHVLVGLVGYGIGCAAEGFHPSYFTLVAPYVKWIRAQMASATPITYAELPKP